MTEAVKLMRRLRELKAELGLSILVLAHAETAHKPAAERQRPAGVKGAGKLCRQYIRDRAEPL